MAVVAVPHEDPWVVSRRLFNELMTRLRRELDRSDDLNVLDESVAIGGLMFEFLPREQQRRIARRLSLVADMYRFEVLESGDDDRGRAYRLAELEMRLHGLFADDDESGKDSDCTSDVASSPEE